MSLCLVACVVVLLGVEVVDLCYVKVAVQGEIVEDLVEELHKSEMELRGNTAWKMVW